MRVTQSMTNRNYLAHLNSALERKNRSERKVESTKRYNRASEDPISAAKALRVRKAISDTQDYLDNLETANRIYTAADSALVDLVSITDSVVEKLTYAANGTQNNDDETILASAIRTFADDMVRTLNIDIAERKVFGGCHTGDTIFKIQGGKVLYNGVDLDTYNDPGDFPYSKPSFADIGIGMTVDSATGRIDEQSALPMTLNGAEVTGCGVDSDGYPKNLIALTLAAAEVVETGDKIKMMEYVNKIRDAETQLTITHAQVGNEEEYIEYNTNRLTTNMETLLDSQNNLEGTDMAGESTNWKTFEAIYNVSLQLASSVIPMSIFQYMS